MPLKLPSALRRLLRKAGLLRPPAVTELQRSDVLWLYDNIAYPSAGAPTGWTAEFISAYFLAHPSVRDVARLVARIADRIGLTLGNDPAAEARIAKRVRPFLDIAREGRTVQLNFGGSIAVPLGPSAADGVAVNILPIPAGSYHDGLVLRSTAVLPDGIDPHLQIADMATHFVGGDGWAAVSGLFPSPVPRPPWASPSPSGQQ